MTQTSIRRTDLSTHQAEVQQDQTSRVEPMLLDDAALQQVSGGRSATLAPITIQSPHSTW